MTRLKRLARRERISLNKAAIRLPENGAGSDSRPQADRIGHSLDHLVGTWSTKQAESLLTSIQSCDQLDEDI